jgi:hypothetical protein
MHRERRDAGQDEIEARVVLRSVVSQTDSGDQVREVRAVGGGENGREIQDHPRDAPGKPRAQRHRSDVRSRFEGR